MLFPCNWIGAANEIKVKVIPMSRYKILVSTLRLRNRMYDKMRFTTAKLTQNKPRNASACIMVSRYKPAAKYKEVLISNMLKSELMNFLFSFTLLATLMAK